jgi:plastocyanin
MKHRRFQDRAKGFLKRWIFVCVICSLGFVISTHLPQLQASSSHDIHIDPQPPFFSPNHLTISLGTPLTWKNRTQEPHTIVSDDCRVGNLCSFDSGFLGPNARFTLPPLRPGTYPYHCGIHPFMRGRLTIHPPQSFPASDI